ncbi:major facilitator superfamily domain-containing protein [Haematococcus lacustris]
MTAYPLPRWYTPLRLLAIFCATNLFVYMDRGLIASNGVNGSPRTDTSPGSGIQGEFGLTYFQDGLLPAAFMVGLLISAPIFAEVCKQYSAFRLMGIGMAVWSAACMLASAAPNFGLFITCRAFVGVGEASFVALAAPFIDDRAPPLLKARWFAAFYLCIPVGFALGYIAGGLLAPALGWRSTFLLEGLAMLPFVAFALTGGAGWGEGKAEGNAVGRRWLHHVRSFLRDVQMVGSQPVWLLLAAGYTLYVAVMGVYAYWGPQAGRALFFPEGQGEQADLVFGGVTVITGVLGSVAGGVLLDWSGGTMRHANLICMASVLLGLLVLLPAFLATHSFPAFMTAFGVGQFLIFSLQAPVAVVQMWSVPQPLRALGASLITVLIHLLGDVPSPPLLGLLQSKLSSGLPPDAAAEKWRVSMSLVTMLLLFSGLLFGLAARASNPSADFRLRLPILESGGSGSDSAPLLADDEEDRSSRVAV